MSTCRCGLDTEPPTGAKWWRPDLDDDPGRTVNVVALRGAAPDLRRAARRTDGEGWDEHGAMVNFYADITPPMGWDQVGVCWANTAHPVVAVWQEHDGSWAIR